MNLDHEQHSCVFHVSWTFTRLTCADLLLPSLVSSCSVLACHVWCHEKFQAYWIACQSKVPRSFASTRLVGNFTARVVLFLILYGINWYKGNSFGSTHWNPNLPPLLLLHWPFHPPPWGGQTSGTGTSFDAELLVEQTFPVRYMDNQSKACKPKCSGVYC